MSVGFGARQIRFQFSILSLTIYITLEKFSSNSPSHILKNDGGNTCYLIGLLWSIIEIMHVKELILLSNTQGNIPVLVIIISLRAIKRYFFPVSSPPSSPMWWLGLVQERFFPDWGSQHFRALVALPLFLPESCPLRSVVLCSQQAHSNGCPSLAVNMLRSGHHHTSNQPAPWTNTWDCLIWSKSLWHL